MEVMRSLEVLAKTYQKLSTIPLTPILVLYTIQNADGRSHLERTWHVNYVIKCFIVQRQIFSQPNSCTSFSMIFSTSVKVEEAAERRVTLFGFSSWHFL